ncbi:MAG: hypothetical protein Ct9H300mP1_31420 [Planctomycetaceae bacterium]|nr:MAG: hypothetical protein Ct9H300mP1_31420 [Planctomycetaceae bacterium]
MSILPRPPITGSTGCDGVTPNRTETSGATGRVIGTIEDGLAAAAELCERLDLDIAFVTWTATGLPWRQPETRRASADSPTGGLDITGAGDMVLATIGLSAAAGCDPETMARLANTSGGLEVEQFGVVTVTRAR